VALKSEIRHYHLTFDTPAVIKFETLNFQLLVIYEGFP
jgi:hypothetical protein